MDAIPAGYPASLEAAYALLKTRDRLSIDDLKINALIEQTGDAFYMALAMVAPTREIRALLERNAHEELGHAHRLLSGYACWAGHSRCPGSKTIPMPKRRCSTTSISAFFPA